MGSWVAASQIQTPEWVLIVLVAAGFELENLGDQHYSRGIEALSLDLVGQGKRHILERFRPRASCTILSVQETIIIFLVR